MFEVTIRTDNQAVLDKLMEFLKELDLKKFKQSKALNDKNVAEIKVEVLSEAPQQNKPELGKGWAKGPIPLPQGFNGSLKDYPAGFGGAKGMFVMSPDFDEPLEDFKEYMY